MRTPTKDAECERQTAMMCVCAPAAIQQLTWADGDTHAFRRARTAVTGKLPSRLEPTPSTAGLFLPH